MIYQKTALACMCIVMMVSQFNHAFSADREESRIGDWVVKKITDPISDETAHIAYIENSSGDAIVVKCDSPGINNVYLHFIYSSRLPYSRENDIGIIYRFDQRDPSSLLARRNNDNVFTTRQDLVKEFVSQLHNSSKAAVRTIVISTHEERTSVYDLNANDTQAALAMIYDGCGAELPY